jgi:multiple sugar transport system permease protein
MTNFRDKAVKTMPRIKGFLPGLLFVLPGLFGFVLFYLYPFALSVGYSFLSRPIGGEFVGLRNYIQLLQSPAYRLGLMSTLIFIGVFVPVNMVLSLLVAMTVKKTGKLKLLFTLIFLIPLVIPSGSMVSFWQLMFAGNGFVNSVLHGIGLTPIDWFHSGYARLVVLIIFVWKFLGFNMVLFMAGLSNIPKEYYEAAAVDGATSWGVFRRITVPCLLPTIVVVSLMSIVNSFRVFREVYLLMGAYPHESVYMLQHFMNNNFFTLNYQRLTTATTLLVLATAIIVWGLRKLERRVLDD